MNIVLFGSTGMLGRYVYYNLKNMYNVEIFQMVDAYFTKKYSTTYSMTNGKTLINKLINFRPGFKYMSERIICKDNFELFAYLQSKGFLITPKLIYYVTQTHKSSRFTPGFLKHQYAKQQEYVERKKQEEEEEAEFLRQID
jgi:hypothetical protein